MGRRFDLLIFDWDGTLADSEALIVNSMQAAIRDLNLPPRENRAIAELVGLGLAEGMQKLYPEINTDELIRLLMGYRAKFVGRGPDTVSAQQGVREGPLRPASAPTSLRSGTVMPAGHNEAPLFENVVATLAQLAEADHLLAIATGKSRPGLNRSLRHHAAIQSLFAATRTADETANKPDPMMLRELLEALDVPVERALMIGDTEYDAHMARAIGMPMLGVTCGVHEPGRILAAGAMALIETVRDLPRWLTQDRI